VATVDDLTDAEYAAIGRIAVESAYLENLVEILILKLLRVRPEIGSVLLERGMLDYKLTALAKIGEKLLSHEAARQMELAKIISDIRINNDQRTTAIHGRWVNITLSDLASSAKRNPRAIKWIGSGPKRKEVDINEAIALSVKIENSASVLWSFAEKVWPQEFSLNLVGLPPLPTPERPPKTSN
jgi:hypothetical protein